MPCLTGIDPGVQAFRLGRTRASLVSLRCLIRGLPLFFRAAPGTPLRALCIIALDTVHVFRHAQPLGRPRVEALAILLDCQACANAVWDGKRPRAAEDLVLRQRLEEAGVGVLLAEYLDRLRSLESRRPPIGGDHRCFDHVRAYREAVARVSLAALVAIAFEADHLDDAVRASQDDRDIATLFQIAMQCQVIDDVIDYRQDLAAGLPSFMTASTSRAEAFAWTGEAVRTYGVNRTRMEGRAAFPLAVALCLITTATTLIVCLASRIPPLPSTPHAG